MNTKFHLKPLSVLIFGLAVIGLTLVGCSREQTTAAAVKEITLAINADPGVIDPVANWVYDYAANQFVPLVEYDYVNAEVIPAGATSWRASADGKTWTFTIRDGWNWSNGDPVTAYDYEYAFRAIVDPATASPTSWRLGLIENASAVTNGELPVEQLGVRAVNDRTLEIKITEPAVWFLSSLTSIGHAVPKETREAHGLEWTLPENIVVNGPYIVTEWEQDNFFVLEKNPSYFNADEVDIDKITLLVVPELSTAMAMYENGELDATDVPPGDIDRVKNDPTLGQEFYTGPRFVLNWYAFDSSVSPTDNVLVRKALSAATDKQTLVERITRGGEVAAPTMTPPGSVGAVDPSEGVGIEFDPAQAKAWLAEAGYPNGRGFPTIVLGFGASAIHTNVAQAVQKMWLDNLNITVELRGWEGGGYNDAASAGAFQVWRNGWGMDFPDAHNVLGEIFRSKPVSGDAAHTRLLDVPAFDALVDAAAVELDPEKRNEMYKEAERILIEDYAVAMPLYWYAVNNLTKPRLTRPEVPSFGQSWWLWTVD